MAQVSLCDKVWKAKGQSEFRHATFKGPEFWVTITVAEIPYFSSYSDEKPGCQMRKTVILMGKKFGKHVSYQAWYTHTDKSSLKPSVRFFTPYLGRKHICQYNLFHFLVAEASFVGSQNDTTEEQSLTSVFGEKTQARQHLCWGREKHWAIFQTKWTNKNAQSSHYRVSACLLISSGYVRWIKAKTDSYATRGKQSTCLGHFLMAFPDEKLQSTTVLALSSFVFVYCST